MKKKFDLDNVKQFLFEKGERIGLGICAGFALLLVALGIKSALGSGSGADGKAWDDALKGQAKNLAQRISEQPKPKPELDDPEYKKELEKKRLSLVQFEEEITWKNQDPSYEMGPYFALADRGDNRRRNPMIKPIICDEKTFEMKAQVDYLRCGYLCYEIDPQKEKATGFANRAGGGAAGMPGMPFGPPAGMMPKAPGGMMGMMGGGMMGGGMMGGQGAGNLVVDLKPKRMVVISAVFPMNEQIEEYRKALRYAHPAELFQKPSDLPNPLGLNVFRCEIIPGAKEVTWTPVYSYDPKKEKVNVPKAIDDMMREAIYDHENPAQLFQYVRTGLVTPLPQLGNMKYPKLNLEGINVAEVAQGEDGEGGVPRIGAGIMMPKKFGPKMGGDMIGGAGEGGLAGGGAGGEQVQYEQVAWKKLNKELFDKFKGKYFIFDPFGRVPAKATDPKMAGMFPPMMMQKGMLPPGMQPPGDEAGGVAAGEDAFLPGMKPPGFEGAANAGQEDLALVRFFDVDLEPGKTYRYSVQVRFANPNFGAKNVAFKALSEVKELVSPFTFSPEIKVPYDNFFYAADQKPEHEIKNGADYRAISQTRQFIDTTVQIHRWMGTFESKGFQHSIADWAIAERLIIRKGDIIGRNEVYVEVPKWNKAIGAFEIGGVSRGPLKPKDKLEKAPKVEGIPVDLIADVPPPLLADFAGGKKTSFPIGSRFVTDDSAVDLLVLMPDNKLRIRNSRQDADPDVAEAKERLERYQKWRERVQELRAPAQGEGGIGGPGKAGPPGGAGS
ncbi:MAG: hypothetical protein L0Y70_01720 [Gemmataceae bacterium]|nr:hypothetical protein [Gemmataceae bacterium]